LIQELRIFCDSRFDEAAMRLLVEGAAPHELVLPQRPVLSVLDKAGPEPAFSTVDVAFGQPDVAAVLQAPRLRWMHLTSAGFTRYDTPHFRAAAAERGLIVTNSSVVYAQPCAEHVLAFMFAQARQFPAALGTICASGTPEWNHLRSASRSLQGQRVVILGFGSIARIVVSLLRPLQMRVVAMRRNVRGDEGISVITEEQLPAALAEADHVINILPDNADSFHFFSEKRFTTMKPGAIFYNIGRGATVDQDALVAALNSGRLGAAWLDVTDPEPLPPDHPLLAARNCLITPHIAGGHLNESETLVRHFLANLRLFEAGAPLLDRIM
jgi:phosphoglycerate dehydrogenase-like enzyme